MPPKAGSALDSKGVRDGKAKGRGNKGGKGSKGGGRGAGSDTAGLSDAARRLQDLDGASVEAESNFEILRAQRAAARQGKKSYQDIKESEGVDEDDPLNSIDDGIRLEPFNMRREMKEGHFDESGFYVLNKDEEKKVTDAWLDTVDQAERTATFKQAEKQNKAGQKTASRMSSMAKNLGPDSEGEEEDEDEKDEDGDGKKDGEATDKDETKTDDTKDAEEEKQEEENVIGMIEELISLLEPLENPAAALARLYRGCNGKASVAKKDVLEPLKMRARVRKQRAEAAKADGSLQQSSADDRMKQKKKRFNEWGYEEQAGAILVLESKAGNTQAAPMETDSSATAAPEAESNAAAQDGNEASTDIASSKEVDVKTETAASEQPKEASTGVEVENGAAASEDSKEAKTEVEAANGTAASENSKEAKTEAAKAALVAEQAAAAEAAKAAAEKSTAASAEAVAKAAEKAALEEKAVEEAAKAFAAEMKLSRSTARSLHPEQGPEAAALVNLNSEDTRDVREKALPKIMKEEVAADGPAAPRPGSKRKAELGELELEKKQTIERLTGLCDRLLERGVLVYDSTRELLAIDVRQRKGENLTVDDGPGAAEGEFASKKNNSVGSSGAAANEVLYTNKRFKASESAGVVASVESVDTSGAAPSNASLGGGALLWQFRWCQKPEEVNGPFDSVTMHGWVTQGCFSGERPVEVRQCNEQNVAQETCWHDWEKIDFSLYV
eukprot:TRINITY_DN22127_c0_g1_i1.p1 TRINITY_DN22127_c0_g1~~TRINITY_DN22127_c0_g1_i1.p1  ORF type:complete len:727 (+),score=225.19 TRINITY_DN22127_c0_g1_i1:133-2313(+)